MPVKILHMFLHLQNKPRKTEMLEKKLKNLQPNISICCCGSNPFLVQQKKESSCVGSLSQCFGNSCTTHCTGCAMFFVLFQMVHIWILDKKNTNSF